MRNLRNFSTTSNYQFGTSLFGTETTYAIQSVNLPGISFTHPEVSSGSVLGHIQGDTAQYNELELNFIIDENLEVWKEIINGMIKMRNTEGLGQQVNCNSFLKILDSNNKEILHLDFTNTLISVISDVEYSSTEEDEIITLPVTITYDYYNIKNTK